MRERPILMSAPMVRAILDGRKTQARRAVKPQHPKCDRIADHDEDHVLFMSSEGTPCRAGNPYGAPGDRLWVREAWKPHSLYAHLKPSEIPHSRIFYRADDAYAPSNTKWWPSIHMPRWASRITLRITDVRVERLNEISEADAEAEGIREPSLGDEVWFGFLGLPRATCPAKTAFAGLWADVNGAQSWAANPWVWVVAFERVTP